MSKDTIKVNMNVYDIPIVVEQLKKLEQENKQLKEDLRVSQSNEETYSLEMQEITKILGLDEDTLFDDVKEIVKYLNEEHNKKLKVFMAYDYYHSILRDLEEWLKKITDNYNSKWEQFITNQNATEEVLKRIDVKIEMLDQVLDKIQELKEKYK